MSEWKHPQHVWCEITCARCGLAIGMFYKRGTIGCIRRVAKKKGWRDYGPDGVFCPECSEKRRVESKKQCPRSDVQ